MGVTERLSVCITCDGGVALAEALEARVPVQRVACMNVCDKPACVSVREGGKPAYLFGNVTPAMADEVVTFLRLFDEAEAGNVTDARPLAQLRFCLIGRIPA